MHHTPILSLNLRTQAVGPDQFCSLLSPVLDFADQATAKARPQWLFRHVAASRFWFSGVET